MQTASGLPIRKRIRLKGFHYGGACAYYLTICAFEKRMLFGSCTNAVVSLSEIGGWSRPGRPLNLSGLAFFSMSSSSCRITCTRSFICRRNRLVARFFHSSAASSRKLLLKSDDGDLTRHSMAGRNDSTTTSFARTTSLSASANTSAQILRDGVDSTRSSARRSRALRRRPICPRDRLRP